MTTLSTVLSSEINDTAGLSQIVCQKCRRDVMKFSRALEQGKELTLFREKYNEALHNQLAEYHLKRQKRCAKESPVSSLDQQGKKLVSALSKPVRRPLIPKKNTEKENFASSNLCALFNASQVSKKAAVTKVR